MVLKDRDIKSIENMEQSRMDNPETLATLSVRENRGQSRMDNPETLVTLSVREKRGQSRMDNPETDCPFWIVPCFL
jgi:hypothetical protein